MSETPPVGRILVADDNQQNRELIEAYLVDDGHEILMAVDGREALDMAREKHPDLILLDIMMPKLSGYEVCSQLKKDPATRQIPVLMITALKEMGDIEKALAAGATFPEADAARQALERARAAGASAPAGSS